MLRRAVLAALFPLACVALAGCGGGDPLNRQPVSGTVAYKGAPVGYGRIEFVPSEKQPTALMLEVKDGKFAVAKDGGLAPGKYLVRIEGYDGPPPPSPDIPGQQTGPMPKQIVPAKYNAQSAESVTVKAGEKNEFVFDLK